MNRIRVAMVGTGFMGEPMARNLVRGGFDLTVWNRTMAKTEGLAKEGTRVAEAVEKAVARKEAAESSMMKGATICGLELLLNVITENLPTTSSLELNLGSKSVSTVKKKKTSGRGKDKGSNSPGIHVVNLETISEAAMETTEMTREI